VAQALNFYETNGPFHGQTAIRAADAARTKTIGNLRFDYKMSLHNCNEYRWHDLIFVKPHTQIECGRNVWKKAKDLIRANLRPATSSVPMPLPIS
jgi:hypothetical protein